MKDESIKRAKKKSLKGLGVLNKYVTEETARMSFDEMRNIAIKKHVNGRCK